MLVTVLDNQYSIPSYISTLFSTPYSDTVLNKPFFWRFFALPRQPPGSHYFKVSNPPTIIINSGRKLCSQPTYAPIDGKWQPNAHTQTNEWTHARRSLFDESGCLAPWFHGQLSREAADNAIEEWEARGDGTHRSGAFLFRYSERLDQVSQWLLSRFMLMPMPIL